MFVSGVNDTGDKREKFSGIIFIIFCEELSWVYFTPKDGIFVYFSFSGRNDPNGILRGPGDTDSWKKTEVENFVSDSL